MDKKVSSVFDIVGRIPVTSSAQHIAAIFAFGQALRSLLPKPMIEVRFDLEGGIRQSSLTATLQTALVAGLAGMAGTNEIKNIYEYAYQEGMKVSFTPASKAIKQPDTTLLTVKTADHELVIALTTKSASDQLVVSEINGVPVALELFTGRQILALTPEATAFRDAIEAAKVPLTISSEHAVAEAMVLLLIEAPQEPQPLLDTLLDSSIIAGAALYQAPEA